MFKEFRAFVLRGNVVDLAVGIVIGAAFGLLVSQFIASFITPLLGVITGGVNIADRTASIGDVTFTWGAFVQALIVFLATAAAIFYFVVRPINKLMERFKTEPEVDSPTKTCTECVSSIPATAKRCAFCTSPQ
ncbi:MAG: large conductance mechanosensitive channel [Actinomycetota bacterium]|jgi:large conductance mechanosensitive channel|nr:large conductance mechanosensitive channel [Actinomycetota bacterium]